MSAPAALVGAELDCAKAVATLVAQMAQMIPVATAQALVREAERTAGPPQETITAEHATLVAFLAFRTDLALVDLLVPVRPP